MGSERDADFLPASDSADEVLESEWSPDLRRRIALGTALVLAALVAGVAVARHGGDTHRPIALAPSPAAPAGIGALQAEESDANESAVFLDGRFLAMRGPELDSFDAAGTHTVAARVPPVTAGYRLAVDPARHRLWLVQLGTGPTTLVVELSGVPLREVGRVEIAGGTADGAVLDGALYLTTTNGVLRLPTVRSPARSLGGVRAGRAIAADPVRHRILLLDTQRADLRGVRVDVPGRRSSTGPAMSLGRGDLVTVNGRIWAAGFTPDGAVLVRVDPGRLAPGAHSAVEPRLGLGAVLAAAGAHYLLVRGSDVDNNLWCIDGRTGAVRQSWKRVTGAVVFGPGGRVYALPPGSGPTPLDSSRCRD